MAERDIDRIHQCFAAQGWRKDKAVLTRYFSAQENREAFAFIAQVQDDIAGYAVLFLDSKHGPFARQGVPHICDLNVFVKHRNKGVANKILDEAEARAFEIAGKVALGVGLHDGYGAAQRIYVKRGYVPDGSGVWWRDARLAQYAECRNDDDLILYFCKETT